jgi:hypothetical protein
MTEIFFKVTHSTVARENIDKIHSDIVMENEDDQEEGRNDTTETGVEWPLQDSFGYERVSMTTRVNVTARIQRIYWRSIEINDDNRSSARWVYC